jgi:hypothetical protein
VLYIQKEITDITVYSTPVVLRVVRGDKREPRVITGPAHSWGNEWGEDLALQVGGVSNETVKYGREFSGASSQE